MYNICIIIIKMGLIIYIYNYSQYKGAINISGIVQPT